MKFVFGIWTLIIGAGVSSEALTHHIAGVAIDPGLAGVVAVVSAGYMLATFRR